jgi:hypothetical protein
MEWLKSLLASWKVRIALVGGALVVATTYGTCSFEPTLVTTSDSVSGTTATPTTTTETVEVSNETTTDVNTTSTETTETTNPTNTNNE